MDMSVHLVHRHADTALVTLTGEVDASNCDRLESALQRLVTGGVRHILVNAGELWFCDIAGARVLARAHDSLQITGGRLAIAASPPVARLLGLLWPPTDPGFPQVITREWVQSVTSTAQAPARHVQVFRRLGPQRTYRTRADVRVLLPRMETREPVSPPADTTARPPITADPATKEAMRSALERSARLRKEAEERLETLRTRIQVTCATLAEVHERLADSHLALEARPVGSAGAASCDGRSHQAKAEQIRRRAAVFAGLGAEVLGDPDAT
jgi:anti-anti-sigma factor